MENASKEDCQSSKNKETSQISQKDKEALFFLKFITFISQDIPYIRSWKIVTENLRGSIVWKTLNKVVFHLLDEESIHTETKSEDACLNQCSYQKESSWVKSFKNKDQEIGYTDGKKIGDDWYFDHDFMSDDISKIVTDEGDIRE